MNKKNEQAISKLVAEYEAMSLEGAIGFFEEKTFLQLIDFYEGDEQLDRALEVVEHAIKNHSFSAEFYIKKAQLLIDCHQEDLAMDALDQAAVFAPSEIEIDLLRAELLSCKECHAEALAIVEDLKGEVSGRALSDVYVVEALVYENLEEFERMFYALKEALKADPLHREALERLWFCVELSKKYEESISLHEEILDRDPYSYLAWYNLGHAHSYLGNYHKAIDAYEFAFVINEKFECAYRDCAEICFELKLYRKALKYYLEILEIFESDGDLLLRIGQCHQQLGNFTIAKTFFKQAIDLDPLNDEVLFHMGMCFAQEGKWESAIRFYKKAIHIEDRQEEYFAALAKAYCQVKEYEKAEAGFVKAIEIAPEETNYWMQYMAYLLESDRAEDALLLMENADQYAAGNELLLGRVAGLMAIGRRKEAFYWLGEVLEEDFDMHPLLFELLPELEQDNQLLSFIAAYRV